MRRSSLALMVLAASVSQARPAAAAPHVFDLAEHMPERLAMMFSMAWFGLAPSDPQGATADKGWGNWKASFAACGLANDPATCADFEGAGKQRVIASKRRPLAGIYSGTGGNDESRRRVDLMLSTVRRPCDQGARLDAFVPQLDSVRFTSAYPNNQQSTTWDIAYRTQVTFLERADLAGLEGAVGVGCDATTYWHFGDKYGLSSQSERLSALAADAADMAKLAKAHPSALKVAGRPLLTFYVDAALLSVDEWRTVLDGARAKSGVDFYALGTTLKGDYFGAFDALVPWVNLGIWKDTSGATLYDHAYAWAKQSHAQLVGALPTFPGRAVFGMITAGFDDYTQDWGKCVPRELPRDPAVLEAQFAYLADARKAGTDVRGLFLQTWDDWTEGSEFEPDVTEGASKLVHARKLIGKLFGEPDDPAGDEALSARWASYGQARNCCFDGGDCPKNTAPPVDLSCPAAGGAAGSAGQGGSAGEGSGGQAGQGGQAQAGQGSSGSSGQSSAGGSGQGGSAGAGQGGSGQGGSAGAGQGGSGQGGAGSGQGGAAAGGGGKGGSAAGGAGQGGAGAAAKAGASGGGGKGGAGASAAQGDAPASDDGGCGCRAAGVRGGGAWGLSLAALAGLVRRRSRGGAARPGQA